jgi:hypothetical protein
MVTLTPVCDSLKQSSSELDPEIGEGEIRI